jgi:hypothetical protein
VFRRREAVAKVRQAFIGFTTSAASGAVIGGVLTALIVYGPAAARSGGSCWSARSTAAPGRTFSCSAPAVLVLSRTLVAVLHDLNQAARYATHLIAMKAGRHAAGDPGGARPGVSRPG